MNPKDLASYYFLDGFINRARELDYFDENGYYETRAERIQEENKYKKLKVNQSLDEIEGDPNLLKTYELQFDSTREQVYEPLKRDLYLYHIEY